MTDATLRARLRSDPHDPRTRRAVVRAGQAPASWRLAAALGHEDYQGLGLRPLRKAPWEVALRYLSERDRRLLACDCAERALTRGREAGWEPDKRSLAAVEVARRYALGEATDDGLDAAWAAAWAAARDAAQAAAWAAAWAAATAARAAAWAAARDAAWAAAWAAAWVAATASLAAAWAAARDAERAWQRRRAADYVLGEADHGQP